MPPRKISFGYQNIFATSLSFDSGKLSVLRHVKIEYSMPIRFAQVNKGYLFDNMQFLAMQ
jgi:hypothetical protein